MLRCLLGLDVLLSFAGMFDFTDYLEVSSLDLSDESDEEAMENENVEDMGEGLVDLDLEVLFLPRPTWGGLTTVFNAAYPREPPEAEQEEDLLC